MDGSLRNVFKPQDLYTVDGLFDAVYPNAEEHY